MMRAVCIIPKMYVYRANIDKITTKVNQAYLWNSELCGFIPYTWEASTHKPAICHFNHKTPLMFKQMQHPETFQELLSKLSYVSDDTVQSSNSGTHCGTDVALVHFFLLYSHITPTPTPAANVSSWWRHHDQDVSNQLSVCQIVCSS